MSNSNWKKRGQAGWNGRKYAKEVSKHQERQFAKKEIKQELQEKLEGSDYRYKHLSRKGDPERKLRGRIKGIETYIQRWINRKDLTSWYRYSANDHLNWLRSWLDKTKKKLEIFKKTK